MDIIRAIKMGALISVIEPDQEAHLRHIFRWYSKTFHTPLHEVDALTTEDVLTAYWECQYEEMEEPDLHEVMRDLAETDEERRARMLSGSKGLSDADKDELFLRKLEQEASAGLHDKKRAKKIQTDKVEQQTFEITDTNGEGFSISFDAVQDGDQFGQG